ncbi:MAG: GNAT family N-acetyltransferase [Pseudomonadota bacterium]
MAAATEVSVEVVGYQPRLAEAFARLNRAWIERYFEMEAEDEKSLGDPEGYVINDGGEIFFTLVDGEPVGCVAMVPVGGGVFELAKMAVAAGQQGRGLGRLLMNACIRFAKERGAREIYLVTNDVLTPAMGLYRSSGFIERRMTDVRYTRGNTEMRLQLGDDAAATL